MSRIPVLAAMLLLMTAAGAVAQTQDRPVTGGSGAMVRWLDKVSGDTADLDIPLGQSKSQGRITVKVTQCRYPTEDPSSNAYAYLIIHDSLVQTPIFQGWMIASSPALNALDSPRYDVWLLHCTTS